MIDGVTTPAPLPALTELLASAHVVALPLATRFRGVDLREAVVLEGPEGWTEFSPFTEYGDDEASTWLAAAIDFGWMPQPAPVRDEVPVNATVPAVDAASVPAVLARFDGCRTAKVKVAEPGQRLADDVARVAAVRAAMGPEGRVRIDANGAWNVDEAERALHALAEHDLEYAEQPCATVDELAELRRRVKYMAFRSPPTRASARPRIRSRSHAPARRT
jgi:O-succinylbenzoate synthase